MSFLQFLDSSTAWQLYFQDAASPVMEGIINLHHDLMFFITFIFFFVLIVMARTLQYFNNYSNNAGIAANVVHGTVIEII
jgi:cytochrome c oxidase subunit 2